MISTNVIGLSMCTREAVQDMTRRNTNGHIINIGHHSTATGPSEAFYAASKAAVCSLTAGLRAEIAEKKLPIRVSLISPSAVNTEFFSTDEDGKATNGKQAKLEAQDVAAAVVWCLAAPPSVDVSEVVLQPTGSR
ncbi:dehydrogenase/reductase SDR family member 11-like [Convolutriloba macropyga]|uniref:dehydrogenase/reductase SDR family member 11-like n=1 Tax=Convolutriloba macropyga TaxID=536237 RepID=UPI003F524F58